MNLYPLLVPPGNDTEVIFNDGGLFGSDSTFTINTTTKAVSIRGIGDGGRTSYDLKVGDTSTPDYGMIQFGNAVLGRTSYKAGNIDLDGAILFQNIGGPVTGEVEFCFAVSTGSSTRFALAKPGVGNASYHSRSMLFAGPAPADTDYVKVSYWQTNNSIFDNLACDTAGSGADLGVQNDLEVEGDIFTDSIKESTSGGGITFQPLADSTTAFQFLDVDGGTAVLNIDSTNERVGINCLPNYSFSVGGKTASDEVRFFFDNDDVGDGIDGQSLFIYRRAAEGDDRFRFWIDQFQTGQFQATRSLRFSNLMSGDIFFVPAGDLYCDLPDNAGSNKVIIRDSDFATVASIDSNGSGYFADSLGINETAPETPIELTHATPYATLHNSTHEDSDGGRESRLIFKGEQSGGEETELAMLEVSHDGAADDQLGKVVLGVNTGSGVVDAFEMQSTTNWVINKTSGVGIKVDLAAPTFGFADLLGDQFSRNTGGTKPTLAVYNGDVDAWQFSDGDEAYLSYHIPHDYVPGTDIHLHVHWSQNNAGATGGTIDFKYFAIYAKGHNQASGSTFTSTPITATFTSININDGGAGLTRYQQHLTEVTISAASATAALFDRDDFEPDGVIELTLEMDANNLTGTPSDPFIHYADIHYQTNGVIGTKSRTPDFYT